MSLALDDFRANLSSTIDRNEIVRLNVGGELFFTRMSTLVDHPDTYFAHQYSGRFNTESDERGEWFIDRDPKAFHVVMNYLRTRRLNLPEGYEYQFLYRSLLDEARYFNISSMIADLSSLIDKHQRPQATIVKPKPMVYTSAAHDLTTAIVPEAASVILNHQIRFDLDF